MGCHHGSGGLCVKCDKEVDACCGEDYHCEECGEYTCYECHYEFNEQCPVCAKEIVTDSQLLGFLLRQMKIERKDLVEAFRAEHPIYFPLEISLTNVRLLCESSVFYEIPDRIKEKLRAVDVLGRDITDRDRRLIVGELRLKGQEYRVIHGFFNKNASSDQNSNNDLIGWGAFGVMAPIFNGRWSENILFPDDYFPSIITRVQKTEGEAPSQFARQVLPSLVCYLGELSHFNSEYDLIASSHVKAAHEWYQKVTKNGTDYSQSWWRVESDQIADEEEHISEEDDDGAPMNDPLIAGHVYRQPQVGPNILYPATPYNISIINDNK